MISNPFYIISVLSSSFLAFFSWSLIIAISIRLFRIKNYRLKSTLRLVPFFGLIVDFAANQYSVAHWINPLSCASCVQRFFLETFYPHLKDFLSQNQMSLVHYLGADYQHGLFSSLFISFVIMSLLVGGRRLIQTYFIASWLRMIIDNSYPCQRPIDNFQLGKKLKKHHVKIYVSEEIQIPLASYKNEIIVPKITLEILTQNEFEAVIAHELEHIRYLDPLVRLFYQLISTLFWWVPTRSWRNQIEQDQEMACDRKVLTLGLDEKSIASALLKTSRQAKTHQSLCYFSGQIHPIKARMQTILGLGTQEEEGVLGFNFTCVAFGVFFFMMCLL